MTDETLKLKARKQKVGKKQKVKTVLTVEDLLEADGTPREVWDNLGDLIEKVG